MKNPAQQQTQNAKRQRQEYRAYFARVEHHLQNAIPEISALMDAKFAETGIPNADSALAQAGLKDGVEIVKDFIFYNELGEAFHHLCYIVEEAQLFLSEQTYAALVAAGTEMQYDVARWQGHVRVLPDPLP